MEIPALTSSKVIYYVGRFKIDATFRGSNSAEILRESEKGTEADRILVAGKIFGNDLLLILKMNSGLAWLWIGCIDSQIDSNRSFN